MSILTCLLSLLTDLLNLTRLVSSTKWWTLQNFIAWLRSLKIIHIYQEQSGPRNEPCGTSYLIKALLETWPLIKANCFLSKRLDLNHSFAICHVCHNVQNKICSTVPKGFCKSTKIPQPIFPLSKFVVISSVRLIKAWNMEHCCLKPNCSW